VSVDPADTGGLDLDKEAAVQCSRGTLSVSPSLQERLYAQDQCALLVVLQGMDTAGKDSVIKLVMSGVSPQGCQVHAFKAPSTEELDHDFLWRAAIRLPARGEMGIFNCSYYEEVVVVRIHPEMLARQKLPAKLVGKERWKGRFEDIHAFERHLAPATASAGRFSPLWPRGILGSRQQSRLCGGLWRPTTGVSVACA
jgi:polyphosphate kinase 2 (PPK2 family)